MILDENVFNCIDQYYYNNEEYYKNNHRVEGFVRINNPIHKDQNSIYKSNCVEFWKYIDQSVCPGIEDNRYLISSAGNTWDVYYGSEINSVSSKGNKFYRQLNLKFKDKRKVRKLHRLVLSSFDPIDNWQNLQVNHIDCSHDNNSLYNLEWCDDSYNRAYSIANGVGTNNFGRQIITLTPEEVHEIYVLREIKGLSSKEIWESTFLKDRTTHDAARHLIPKIATGRSKLYSQFYH